MNLFLLEVDLQQFIGDKATVMHLELSLSQSKLYGIIPF